ncbi:MAG: hypothetical protein V1781_05255 [Bacteroidota bacterium]
MKDRKIEIQTDRKRKHKTLTVLCCQWRCNASYDSDVQIETYVLRRKFSGKIATEQQPPSRLMMIAFGCKLPQTANDFKRILI